MIKGMDSITKQYNKQQGFTLIELIIVIVILGILAVTAAPRFIDLTSDANEASLKGMHGAMKSAATLVYTKSIIQGLESSVNGSVDLDTDGVGDIDVEYGYPSDARSSGITLAMSDNFANEWAWSTRNGPQRVVLTSSKLSTSGAGQKVNALPIIDKDCYLTYIAPTALGGVPTIELTTSGC
jgi:MSHA pilin protein MshA|tara:strand:- start:62 stop:607 length:546 start_codon:yes stop_codon:yes gene_type:complete